MKYPPPAPQMPMPGQMPGPMPGQMSGPMPGQMSGPMTGPMTITQGAHYMDPYGGVQAAKPVPHAFIISMNVINAFTQLMLGCVVIAAFMYANALPQIPITSWPTPWPPAWWFNTYEQEHIYLCVLGYMILMSQAILTFNPHAGWANTLVHPHKRTIHWIMQILGSGLAIIGCIMKLFDRVTNFRTAHGIIGVIAMVLTMISLVGGVLHFVMPTRTQSNGFRTCHGCLGSLTITAAFIALILAFDMQNYRFMFGDTNAGLAIAMTVFALAGIMAASCTRMYRRLNS